LISRNVLILTYEIWVFYNSFCCARCFSVSEEKEEKNEPPKAGDETLPLNANPYYFICK
jgi:hypothetical protein